MLDIKNKKSRVILKKIQDCLTKEPTNYLFLPGYKRGYREIDIIEATKKYIRYEMNEKIYKAKTDVEIFIKAEKVKTFEALWNLFWKMGIAWNIEADY